MRNKSDKTCQVCLTAQLIRHELYKTNRRSVQKYDRLFLQNAEIKQIKRDILRFRNESAIFLYKKCKNQIGSGKKGCCVFLTRLRTSGCATGKGPAPFLFHSPLWNNKFCQAREGRLMTKKIFCTAARSGIAGRSVPAGGFGSARLRRGHRRRPFCAECGNDSARERPHRRNPAG